MTVKRAIAVFVTLTLLLLVPAGYAGCGPAEDPGQREADGTREAASPGSGVTWYVSPDGSDGNPGTRDAPWANPGYGSKRIGPGDTLVLLAGRYALSEYWEDMVTPPSGTADAWTTIRGEPGARPVLAGSNNLFSAFEVSGKSYVRIENLEVTSDDGEDFREGVSATDSAVRHLVLKDLYIHHIDEMAVDIADVDDLRVENCVMTHCGFGCLAGPVGTSGGWRNVVVTGCTLSWSGHYYRGGPGPSPYDRPDGFGIEPSEGPVEITNTRAEHNRGDGLDSKCRNTYIHECIVANNSCDGVKLWGGGSRLVNTLIYGTGDGVGGASPWAGLVIGTEESGATFEVTNVTLHDNPARQAYPMYVQYDESARITLNMRNTIVANGQGPAYFGDNARLVSENNLFHRPGGGIQVEAGGREYTAGEIEKGALGKSNLSIDPAFERPAWGEEGDYHLQIGSPAIDAGTAKGAPASDLDGNARPAGGGFDMGAYEYGSSKPATSGTRTWGHASLGAASASLEWYLAEGCTAGGFETWVLISNPDDRRANVTLTYMTDTGPVDGPGLVLEPRSRATLNATASVPERWDVSAVVGSDVPVIAERAVYWKGRTGAHCSIGATAAAKEWYLAEGCTAGGFETWVLVQNPGGSAASVRLAFMTEGGRVEGPEFMLEARSRRSINVADTVPGTWSVSTVVSSVTPVVAERAVYWGARTGGHCSVGVTGPAGEWLLAEGSTGGEFETWVLVLNPGGTEASVEFSYLTATGRVAGPVVTLPPGTRRTVNVADTVPGAWSVSTQVTSSEPVVAERAMYWGARREGHNSTGAAAPHSRWELAEGCTAPGFETWVLVQNPGSRDALVTLTFMTGEGEAASRKLKVRANTRVSVNAADSVGTSWGVSTAVTSYEPVVAERAVYGTP